MGRFVIESEGVPRIAPRSCGHVVISLENPETIEANSKSLFLLSMSDIHTEGVINTCLIFVAKKHNECH